ncbi:hypothetical protein A9Q93_10700, partial [Nonlabens dokdonensis]
MKESGLWYLPNSTNKVPGKLYVDKDKDRITLKLYTESYLSGNPFKFPTSEREDDYIELILGDTNRGTLGDLTLFGCSFAKLAPIAGELHELHYSIQFVFNYVHILKRSHLRFNHVEVLFPNSDNFYNSWNSTRSSVDEENPKEEYVKVSSTLKISDELSIDIVDSKHHTISLSKDYEVKHSNHLTFNYKQTVDIDRIYKDCITLQKMMEFSGRRQLAFIIKNAKIDFKHIKGQEQHTNI